MSACATIARCGRAWCIEGSRAPGVHNWYRQISKVARVMRCESRVTGNHDAGDHRVAQVTCAAGTPPFRHQHRRGIRGRGVEWHDTALNVVLDQSLKLNLQ